MVGVKGGGGGGGGRIQDLPENGACGMGLWKANVAGFPAIF